MNRLRLGDALHRAPRFGAGLSSVWMVVLGVAVVQVLNDSFGWLEEDNIRLIVGFVGGVVAMILTRMARGSRF